MINLLITPDLPKNIFRKTKIQQKIVLSLMREGAGAIGGSLLFYI
jgi:hypothetical protein